ncbi:MAG: hypothetical protein HY721_18445 [Planctomycetes bacterium]|nr:hypothetical protein [Planctomycetota bacterium]
MVRPASVALLLLALGSALGWALGWIRVHAQGESEAGPTLEYPPRLPGGKTFATGTSPELLEPTETLREGVEIARTPPAVDFMYYAGQDHPGAPWSVWGDGCAAGEKYYSAVGDHRSPRGTAKLYEYDAAARKLRLLVDLREFLESSGKIPAEMNYIPGKVHGRIDLGNDGWLYYSTHRGSPRTTTDANGYRGDWILRTHPETAKTEIVAEFPVPKHAIPMSVLDPERLLFYGGTAPGKDAASQEVTFFVWDIRRNRRIYNSGGGPDRCAIFSRSTGRVFWNGKMYDPAKGGGLEESKAPHVRSATRETPQGIVYGTSGRSADLWAFDVKAGTLASLGPGAAGRQEYVTTIDADPTGRYLYYIPGAHGGGPADGTPVVQFDVKTRKRKAIAFLHRHCLETYGYTLDGTFSSALDPRGEKLYITWNGMRKGSRSWECCALTVVHIPASERP